MRRQAVGAAAWMLCLAIWGAGTPRCAGASPMPSQPAENRFEVEHRQAVAANPPDLRLTLQLQAGPARFRQGGIIRLDLSFSSTSPGRYRLDAAGYDRSGRLHLEEFHLDPGTDVADPLWEYFAAYARWGGGIRQEPLLKEAPETLHLDLNEWVRFDRPGTYRLYVTSRRVAGVSSSNSEAAFSGVATPVSSNVVEITIDEADARWSGPVLADAIRDLDTGTSDVARKAACRTIRFLGSPAAAREMARRYDPNDRPCNSELMFGLIGSPQRQAAIQAINERLEAPDKLVDGWFLENLALIVADPAGIPLHSPEVPGQLPGHGVSDEEWRTRHATIQTSFRRQAARLLAALPRKTGRARAVSALTLLDLATPRPNCGPGEASAVPPEEAEHLRQVVAEGFSLFPAAEQHSLLSGRWALLRGPGMAAELRHLYLDPPALPFQGGESLATLALRRLYEMAPAEAMPLLFEEARRPMPHVGREALRLLPEEATSKLELEIVEHLEVAPMAAADALSFLVARYATRAVLSRIQALYARALNDGMCAQAPLVGYFLRVEPALGKSKLLEVLDTPPQPGLASCAARVLGEVGRLFYSSEVESVAISRLDDPDLEVAIEAAKLLGLQGSPAAEAPLWRRLELWHERWKPQARELRLIGNYKAESLGRGLREAIAESPAWLVDRPQLERLRGLSVGPDSGSWLESQLTFREAAGRISLGISFDGDGHPELTVAQYTLHSLDAARSKLGQFPRGTVFRLGSCVCPSLDMRREALVKELTSFVQSHGMVVEQ